MLTGRPKAPPGNAAAPARGYQAKGEGGSEQVPGTQNEEGTRVNSCSITYVGSPNSRQVNQAEAEAAVHMGAALSQWLAAGVLHPKL